MSFDKPPSSARRSFIGKVAAGTLALATAPIVSASASATMLAPPEASPEADAWIKALKEKHKQFFDAPGANNGFPLMFAATYLQTMTEHYKLMPGDITAMVVLRHFIHNLITGSYIFSNTLFIGLELSGRNLPFIKIEINTGANVITKIASTIKMKVFV